MSKSAALALFEKVLILEFVCLFDYADVGVDGRPCVIIIHSPMECVCASISTVDRQDKRGGNDCLRLSLIFWKNDFPHLGMFFSPRSF